MPPISLMVCCQGTRQLCFNSSSVLQIGDVGSLTEEKSCVNMFESRTGVWVLEICYKLNVATV